MTNDAFDRELLLEHIQTLLRGQPIDKPVYDYALHERRKETHPCAATPVVVLEGILVLALEPVLPLLDLRVYVDTPSDLRLVRRVRRDVSERGRSPASVLDQYLASVRPMHQAFIEPSRSKAHLVVQGEGDTSRALEVLRAWVRSRA